MEIAGALLALLVVLFMVAAVIVTVKAVRAVKRGVERTVAEGRRTVEETSLKARKVVQTGPAGEIAALRLGLRNSIDPTRRELEAAVQADAGLRESLDLLNRLHAYARELDGELKQLEREPDKGRLAARMPDLRERTKRIVQSADSLRWAAQDRARHTDAGGLESLTAQIDVEAGALRHWTPAEPAADEGESESGKKTEPARPAIPAAEKNVAQDAFQTLLAKIEKVRRPESA